MKNILLFISLLLLFIIVASVNKEKLYYWSDGKKHYMSVDKNSMLVKTKPGTDLRALTSRIQKADLSFSVNKTVKGEIIIKSKTNPLDIDSIKVEIPEIESVAYGLNFEGEETPIFINGEILLQPKPGVTIDRILHLIEGEYNSFVKRRYNTFKVLIRD